MPTPKIKVVILGGGCGGIATAFWLSSTPALRARYDITVYTRGWRLGGKGASGRDVQNHCRIEEHGLHMWMGCYENAFRTMRECYKEWRPRADCALKTLDKAFTPQRLVTLQQLENRAERPAWTPWHCQFPRSSGSPGDYAQLTLGTLVWRVKDWLHCQFPPSSGSPGDYSQLTLGTLVWRLKVWLQFVMTKKLPFRIAGIDKTLDKMGMAAKAPENRELALQAVKDLAVVADELRVRSQGSGELDADALALRETCSLTPAQYVVLAELGVALAGGVLRDILFWGFKGFDRINVHDFRDWLRNHGASEANVTSAVVRALYDLGFAYPNGDNSSFGNGRGAAGSAARFILELGLGYKDAPLWKMNAGMGDIVFTPLFQVLEARNVHFKFFHRVDTVAADRSGVRSIVLRQQAKLKSERYQPFVDVGHLDCWPNEPLWDQLVDGATLKAQCANFESIWDSHGVPLPPLKAGVDFDVVVLAMPPAMIRQVAPDLSCHNADWRRMIENSASVATQAFQLWLSPSLLELGWTCGPTVLTSYAAPFDTWADMTHLLARECWIDSSTPKTLAYFCGPMKIPDPLPSDPICETTKRVRQDAKTWLSENARKIWPKLPGHFVVSDFYRSNIDPSEQYVQTPPGSVAFRLDPGSATYSNLYLAGDWTLTRYSSGCVESAIESGMLASQAICGEPRSIYGH